MKKPDCQSCLSLPGSPLKDYTAASLTELRQSGEPLILSSGTTLFEEDDPANKIYCICEGALKMVKRVAVRKSYTLKICGQGELLGIPAIMDDQLQYKSTCQTVTDVALCQYPASTFRTILRQNPSLSLRLMQALNSDISYLEEKMVAAPSKRDAKKRLVQTFLSLREKLSPYDKKTASINLPYSDIADLAGISSHQLKNFLAEMEQAQWLTIHKQDIRILDEQGMKQILAEAS